MFGVWILICFEAVVSQTVALHGGRRTTLIVDSWKERVFFKDVGCRSCQRRHVRVTA